MPEDKQLLMVTVSGRDRPGITAAFSRVMLEHNVDVVDIEQPRFRTCWASPFCWTFPNLPGPRTA